MFPFVHPTISALLQCHLICNQASTKGPFLDTEKLQIIGWNSYWTDTASLEAVFLPDDKKDDLALLAQECDEFVFKSGQLVIPDEGFQRMVDWGKGNSDNPHTSAECLLASLLATNRLESAIRMATGHNLAGRAPLLKNMIENLNEQNTTGNSSLVSVLRAFLLPNGLNFRNLLWHGFVADVPRPWLALVLVLAFILERDYSASINTEENPVKVQLPTLNAYSEYEPILARGKELRTNDNLHSIDSSWIVEINPISPTIEPTGSYQEWWNLIQHWIVTNQNYPICTCIILTCLLEHGLRQLWCQENNRPDDRIARPGFFYVTLDGHGQRYKHDVLLHPSVGDEAASNATENALMSQLGGPIMVLLSDMYCSPCGGSNLRASLAHGLWDTLLQQELSDKNVSVEDTELLLDLVDVLLVLMEAIGNKFSALKQESIYVPLENYRPMFSYTASCSRNIGFALEELNLLVASLHDNNEVDSAIASTNLRLDQIASLRTVSLQSLSHQAKALQQQCGGEKLAWTVQDILLEHEMNKVFASLGAARTLLEEVAGACAEYREAITCSDDDEVVSSRKRKQYLRVLAASELTITVYPFAVLTALLLLEYDLTANTGSAKWNIDRGTLLQAVKRSRMMVSTVSNFITANTDRAIRLLQNTAMRK